MNKKYILSAILMMASATMVADDYNYLTISYGAEGIESVALPTVQKITFSEGNCVVTTNTGDFTFPLSEMKKMYFTAEDEATAIEALPEQTEALQFNAGKLMVKSEGLLRIYNANGALLHIAAVKEGASINLGNLPTGVYIVNMGSQTIKVVNK